jgi:putative ABC transport system substrate-binding protein
MNTPRVQFFGFVRFACVARCVALLGLTTLARTQTPPVTGRVLVVNSDASVAKYSEVQIAFTEGLGAPASLAVDLGTAGESQLRRMLAVEKPGVIYCIGASAFQAVSRLARDNSIVLSSAINWERLKPGKQTRVIANELSAITQLTLFRHFFPQVRRIGVVYNRDINKQWFDQAVLAGKEVGVEIFGRTVNRASQVPNALKELAATVDALWLVPDPVVLEDPKAVQRYFDRAAEARKPVFAYSPAYADFGAALILAPDMPTIGRQAAGLVQDFAGAQAVTHPAGSAVTLNLTRVKECGLELNRDALDSVNHLIR